MIKQFFRKQTNEELHAEHFVKNAIQFIKTEKSNLQHNVTIKKAINEKEFDYWATLVALRAADSGAIIKYGISHPLTKRLLKAMIKEFTKLNPYVTQNLQYNQKFIQDLDKQGRLMNKVRTIPEANGFWLLYSIKIETLDYSNPDCKEAAIIIGDWLFSKFTKYWDDIPNYK